MLLKSALLPSALDQLKKYAVFSKVTFTLLDWQILGAAGTKAIEKCGQFSAQIRVDVKAQQPRVILLNPTRLALDLPLKQRLGIYWTFKMACLVWQQQPN